MESCPFIVWLDPKEVDQRVELPNVIHHRSSSKAESGHSSEVFCCPGRIRVLVLDTLGFVEDNTVEYTLIAQEREELFHRCSVVVTFMPSQFLLVQPHFETLEFRPQCPVCRQYDVVSSQFVPTKLLSLAVNHVDAQSVGGGDLRADLSFPLLHQCNGSNDEIRLKTFRLSSNWEKGMLTLHKRSEDGRQRIRARVLIVLPSPMSSAKMPPLLVPSSIDFSHVRASFWCSY